MIIFVHRAAEPRSSPPRRAPPIPRRLELAASVSLTWLLISLTKEQKSSDERGCRAASPHSASRFWAQSRPRLSTRRKGGMREAVQKAGQSTASPPNARCDVGTNHACNVSYLPDRKHMAARHACLLLKCVVWDLPGAWLLKQGAARPSPQAYDSPSAPPVGSSYCEGDDDDDSRPALASRFGNHVLMIDLCLCACPLDCPH